MTKEMRFNYELRYYDKNNHNEIYEEKGSRNNGTVGENVNNHDSNELMILSSRVPQHRGDGNNDQISETNVRLNILKSTENSEANCMNNGGVSTPKFARSEHKVDRRGMAGQTHMKNKDIGHASRTIENGTISEKSLNLSNADRMKVCITKG